MGFHLKNDVESYSFPNYVKEMFFDSETNMAVISGVPGKEINEDRKTGKVLEGPRRTPGFAILPSWQMSESKKQLNDLAKSQRRPLPRQLYPNHYWNRKKISPISPLCSSRWSARSRSTASTVGSGTATPTRRVGQWLQAGRREDGLSLLPEIARARAEDVSASTRDMRRSRGRWGTSPIRRTSRRPPRTIRTSPSSSITRR